MPIVSARTHDAKDVQAAGQASMLLTDGPVDGATLGQWTARWWQWAIGQDIEPYLDPDGRFCEAGQGGPVWFLAGTDGSFAPRRTCVVPEGKYLLLPIINMIYKGPAGANACKQLQAFAAVENDQLASAFVSLDGKLLGDMRLHRVRSDGCFALDPDDAHARHAACDGYWLMLKPLSRGRHTLMVNANYGASDHGYGAMVQSFEYVLDVGSPVLIGSR